MFKGELIKFTQPRWYENSPILECFRLKSQWITFGIIISNVQWILITFIFFLRALAKINEFIALHKKNLSVEMRIFLCFKEYGFETNVSIAIQKHELSRPMSTHQKKLGTRLKLLFIVQDLCARPDKYLR